MFSKLRQDGKKRMSLSKQQKSRATKDFKKHEKDTGSAEYQAALFTEKIKKLSSHLKKNPKDKHSRRGLLQMVQQRKKLLQYLSRKNEDIYKKITENLGLKS